MFMNVRSEILESSGGIETDKIMNDIRTQVKVPNLNEMEGQGGKWCMHPHIHTHTQNMWRIIHFLN